MIFYNQIFLMSSPLQQKFAVIKHFIQNRKRPYCVWQGAYRLPSATCVPSSLVSSPDKSHYASEWLQRPRDPSWQGTRHKRMFIILMDPNHSSKLASNPFCLGFPGFFPRPFGRLSSVLQITFTNPLAARAIFVVESKLC